MRFCGPAPRQVEEPALHKVFKGHRRPVNGVVFNRNMKQMISGSADGCVMLWNFRPQGSRAFRFAGHQVRSNNTHVRACTREGGGGAPECAKAQDG